MSEKISLIEKEIEEKLKFNAEEDRINRFKKEIEKMKLDYGLIGLHATIAMSVLDPDSDVVSEMRKMHESYLAGDFEDLTDTVL